jgi:glycosyltransferase involved in cell wall biosynthesis
MPRPAIAVVCAFHNEVGLIRHTLRSLNDQSFRDFEAVFVDDGSTDGTADIVRQIARFPFRILRNGSNLGLAGSLNRGIAATEAPLIARIDADDLMDPRRLERQAAAFAADDDLVLLGGQGIKIDDHGADAGVIGMPVTDHGCRFALNFYAPFIHPSVMYRKADALAVGGYDEETFPAEDYDLWCRLAVRGRIANLPNAMVRYRVRSSGSITSTRRSLQLQKHLAVMNRYTFQTPPGTRDLPLQFRKVLRLAIDLPWPGRRAMLRKASQLLRADARADYAG